MRLAALLAASTAFAQTVPDFEAASIHPNKLDDHIVTIDVGPGGRFAARGYTLVLLIQRAYGVMDWNVTGGPPWIRIDRFDIVAKSPVKLTETQLQPMLQKLLAARFKLKLHDSTAQTSGYEMTVARGGAKIHPAAEEHADTFRMGSAGLEAHGISMPDFARFVSGKLGVIAVDRTELKGPYEVKAEWPPQSNLSADSRDDQRFTVFRAIEDQLGLKFTAKRITIRTLVIDHAERASASDN
jgi:uncharacterized protein (TIGR03435 family)